MKDRKIFSKSRYVWSFLIGTAIFIFVFFITFMVSQSELRNIGISQNKISYGLFEQKIINSFFSENMCDENDYQNINKYRSIQIGEIEDLEKKYGKVNTIVMERKKFYTLIQVAHLDFLENRRKNCNDSTRALLFFYSNQEEDQDESNNVGRMLDIVGINERDIQIYSFDYFLDSEIIELLKRKYNVTDYPTIINPYGKRVVHPKNVNDIEAILG